MKKQKLKEMILGQFKQAGTKKTLKLLFDLIKKRVIRLSKWDLDSQLSPKIKQKIHSQTLIGSHEN